MTLLKSMDSVLQGVCQQNGITRRKVKLLIYIEIKAAQCNYYAAIIGRLRWPIESVEWSDSTGY